MSLVNRRGSQKLDFLRKPGDINNKIFERESMRKLIVSVALSPDVVTQLDSNRGKGIKISRSSLIEDAVRVYLLYLEGSEAPNNQKTLTA
jgi:hypothetical protein